MTEECLKEVATFSNLSDPTRTNSIDTTADVTLPKNELKQSIKPFHVFMMSTATGIGTGLLVGNGRSIAIAGLVVL